MLEPDRVGGQQHDVGDGGQRERPREPVGRGQPGHDQRHRRRHGAAHRQPAGGDRAGALVGVQAVLVAVGDVVQQVDRARQGAEDDERGQGRPQGRGEELLAEDEPAEDEQVLDPLPRPQRDEDGAHARR